MSDLKFHKVEVALGFRGLCKLTECGLGQSPRSFAIYGHYSTPDGLNLNCSRSYCMHIVILTC